MTKLRRKTAVSIARVLIALVLSLALAGCGGTEPAAGPVSPPADETGPSIEDAWLALLAELGLEPDEGKVEIAGAREDGELELTITVPDAAPAGLTFGDGLYAATAYGYTHGGWTRVDTADIRTEIAPILQPGQTGTVRLPLRDFEGGCCRVLVPVEGFGAWADIG
jgi:hypothetical protein